MTAKPTKQITDEKMQLAHSMMASGTLVKPQKSNVSTSHVRPGVQFTCRLQQQQDGEMWQGGSTPPSAVLRVTCFTLLEFLNGQSR